MFSHSLSPRGSPLLGVALPDSLFSDATAGATNKSIATSAFLFDWQGWGSSGCNSLEVLIATTIEGKQISWRLGLTRPHSGGVRGDHVCSEGPVLRLMWC